MSHGLAFTGRLSLAHRLAFACGLSLAGGLTFTSGLSFSHGLTFAHWLSFTHGFAGCLGLGELFQVGRRLRDLIASFLLFLGELLELLGDILIPLDLLFTRGQAGSGSFEAPLDLGLRLAGLFCFAFGGLLRPFLGGLLGLCQGSGGAGIHLGSLLGGFASCFRFAG